MRKWVELGIVAALAAAVLALGGCGSSGDDGPALDRFDSGRAFTLIEHQLDSGPRPAGSRALRLVGEVLRRKLPGARFERVPGGLRNIVATLPGASPAIVVAAHYDTEALPAGFVGANDGAAGAAAVVELARAIEPELAPGRREIRFLLFDGEEEPAGCPATRFRVCGLRGSRSYVARRADEIAGGGVGEMILLDYVANRGLRIPRELNSDPELWGKLREAAAAVGVLDRFPDSEQGGIVDDHIPFRDAGVPAINLIDFSYAYRDTVEDTLDKLDPAALDAVGETIAALVLSLASPS